LITWCRWRSWPNRWRLGHGGARAPVVEDAFSLGAYGFVEWSEWEVHVYNEIAPLTPRQLLWASDFTRVTHNRLLAPSDPTA
jgi:hypothetical protein